ncbi:MAG: alanine racemase [Candidatus Aminicenantes bacterium]|nr:alanine racemase [Candidatus Aminicenantes bacterium]
MKTHIEINAMNLLNNLRLFKESTNKKLMFVVKANAYGHGLKEIIEITKTSPLVEQYAVDSLPEALLIASLQPKKPILVLGWTDQDELEELIAHGFETTVPSAEHLRWVKNISKKLKRKALIHLKIETGTNRLGLAPEKAISLLQGINEQNIEIRGIYSHFANVEDTSDPAFARKQMALFNSVLPYLPSSRILKHFSSSASTLLFPETFFDIVRIGISAYGYWPSRQTHALYLEKNKKTMSLEPVLSWFSNVAQIKEVKKGAAIGYGLTYKTFNKARIAVVPLGYYDGYDRKLSNVSQVLIHGVKAPVRGRICMNMFMVEVTHIKNVKVGDRVTILGSENAEKVDADMLAEWSGTINYEILARINPFIPRFVV